MAPEERTYRLRGIPPGNPRERCDELSPAGLLRGIAQFNARAFFECHETLEELWNAEPGPIRVLYKGILQVGVGCYHLLRGNYQGTIIKLQTGADYLGPYRPRCQGVEVEQLIADARRLRTAVVALGPERLAVLDRSLLPVVLLSDPPIREKRAD